MIQETIICLFSSIRCIILGSNIWTIDEIESQFFTIISVKSVSKFLTQKIHPTDKWNQNSKGIFNITVNVRYSKGSNVKMFPVVRNPYGH